MNSWLRESGKSVLEPGLLTTTPGRSWSMSPSSSSPSTPDREHREDREELRAGEESPEEEADPLAEDVAVLLPEVDGMPRLGG